MILVSEKVGHQHLSSNDHTMKKTKVQKYNKRTNGIIDGNTGVILYKCRADRVRVLISEIHSTKG